MEPEDRPVVIVGGGPAGQRCAEAYREAGGERRVVLVTADDRAPYYRPALTKEYLQGAQRADELPLVEEGWYEAHGIDLRIGTPASGIDPVERTILVGAEVVEWSSCVLATGSRSAPLPVEGAAHPKVVSIRSVLDTDRVLMGTDGVERVVVIGSGFIGCEAAASLRMRGHEVVMVSTEAAPQSARLGDEVAGFLTTWLRDVGVEVQGGRKVARIDDGLRVITDAGVVEGGLVLAATGAKPVLDLARMAGATIEQGVLVDESMRSSVPGVFAIGDIAEAVHPIAKRRLRVEHWGDALEMGAVAGTVIAGQPAQWIAVPGFWSTIGERTLKHAAWDTQWDDVTVEGDADGFTAWYRTDGVLTGVLTHERDVDYERGKKLLVSDAVEE